MVERAARVLAKRFYRGPLRPKEKNEDRWVLFKDDARDVIEAAFQVTDEDAKAFFGDGRADIKWEIVDSQSHNQGYKNLQEAMQALSDAALKEGS